MTNPNGNGNFKPQRGRPPSPIPRDDWHVKVDSDLSLYFRMKYHDEFTGTTKKGALSELVNALLRAERERDTSGE